jgi:hypothetical protein
MLFCSRWIACNLRLPSSDWAAGFGNPAGAKGAANIQEGDYPFLQAAQTVQFSFDSNQYF